MTEQSSGRLVAEVNGVVRDATADQAVAGILQIAQAAGLYEEAQRIGSVAAVCDRLARWCAERRGLTLAERITSVLTAGGFVRWAGRNAPGPHLRGEFHVTEGVGATVGVVWRDVPADSRATMLTAIGAQLQADGLRNDVRAGYVYVWPLPGEPRAGLISPGRRTT